jgi:uncharacterized protein
VDPRVDRDRIIPKRWKGPYRRDLCSEPSPELLLEGIRQFNRGEFFEQHETLEELWMDEPDDIRYLYQGILQVGVGFHHLERGNYRGAVAKLRTGIERLEWFAPACQGVQLDAFLVEAKRCLETLLALGPERVSEFDRALIPRIQIRHHGT